VAAGHLTLAEGARKLKVRRADFSSAVQKGGPCQSMAMSSKPLSRNAVLEQSPRH
jgi:hypothetical protein